MANDKWYYLSSGPSDHCVALRTPFADEGATILTFKRWPHQPGTDYVKITYVSPDSNHSTSFTIEEARQAIAIFEEWREMRE